MWQSKCGYQFLPIEFHGTMRNRSYMGCHSWCKQTSSVRFLPTGDGEIVVLQGERHRQLGQMLQGLAREYARGMDSNPEAWERLQEYIPACPHHGINEWLILQRFYNGLTTTLSAHIDVVAGGAFVDHIITKPKDLVKTIFWHVSREVMLWRKSCRFGRNQNMHRIKVGRWGCSWRTRRIFHEDADRPIWPMGFADESEGRESRL